MSKPSILIVCVASFFLSSCSPRDFLTRRLAGDLIAASDTFRAPQRFQLRTGVISNKDYVSPDYLVLQHRGWISGAHAPCPPALVPAPCWDVSLTPSGVDTFQSLIAPGEADKQLLNIPTVRRELIGVTGISKQANIAEVEFDWKWVPVNEVGAALYPGDLRYQSSVMFRCYDDGWRLVDRVAHPAESLDESLKNAESAR
ncbi:MAG: hypothetical protein WAL52_23445 [Candidatus Sulfotelmatobacter sp.]